MTALPRIGEGASSPDATVRPVDAHLHCWDLDRAPYPWLGPELGSLYRTIDFPEVLPLLAATGVARTVLVQSDENTDDNQYLFEVAREHPEVAGVVAWLPLGAPDETAELLDGLLAHPKFCGVRVGINHVPDTDWLLRPEVDESLGLLEARGVPFDVVSVRRRHLELVPVLSERHPQLRMVIDHLSKPPIKRDDPAYWEPWRKNLARAAENPNVFAKVSGLFPARGDMADWTAADIRPTVDYALDHFGPDRLMFGSDWPIAELAGGYAKVWDELSSIFDELGPPAYAMIVARTACNFYGIDEGGA